MVTLNWLAADPLRFRMLTCDKSIGGRRSRSLLGSPQRPVHDSDVAYVLSQTHRSLQRQGTVPSLLQQAVFLDKEGCCRFLDPEVVHEAWNGIQGWEHCGACLFCRPLGEGETQQTVTSVSIKV